MARVHIVPLSDDVRESDVERFFRGYGRIREVFLKRDFAFVVRFFLLCDLIRWDTCVTVQELDNRRDAEDAIHDLNGKELLGHR